MFTGKSPKKKLNPSHSVAAYTTSEVGLYTKLTNMSIPREIHKKLTEKSPGHSKDLNPHLMNTNQTLIQQYQVIIVTTEKDTIRTL